MRSLRKVISFVFQTLILCTVVVFIAVQFEFTQTTLINLFSKTHHAVTLSQYEGLFPFWGGYKSLGYQSDKDDTGFQARDVTFQLSIKHLLKGEIQFEYLSIENLDIRFGESENKQRSRLLPDLSVFSTGLSFNVVSVRKLTVGKQAVSIKGQLKEEGQALRAKIFVQDLRKKSNVTDVDIVLPKDQYSSSAGRVYVQSLDKGGLLSELVGHPSVYVMGDFKQRAGRVKGDLKYRMGDNFSGEAVLLPGISDKNGLNNIKLRLTHRANKDAYLVSGDMSFTNAVASTLDVTISKNNHDFGKLSGEVAYRSSVLNIPKLTWDQHLPDGEHLKVNVSGSTLHVTQRQLNMEVHAKLLASNDSSVFDLNMPVRLNFDNDVVHVAPSGELSLAPIGISNEALKTLSFAGEFKKTSAQGPLLTMLRAEVGESFIGLRHLSGGGQRLEVDGKVNGRLFKLRGQSNVTGVLDIVDTYQGRDVSPLFENFRAKLDLSKPHYPAQFQGESKVLLDGKLLDISVGGWIAKGFKFVALDNLKLALKESFLEVTGDYNVDNASANFIWHLYTFNLGDLVDRDVSGTLSLRGDANISSSLREVTFQGEFHKAYMKGLAVDQGNLEGRLNLDDQSFSTTLNAQRAQLENALTIEEFSATSAGSFDNFLTSVAMRGFAERALKGNLAFSVQNLQQFEVDAVSVQFGAHQVLLGRPIVLGWGKDQKWHMSPVHLTINRGELGVLANQHNQNIKVTADLSRVSSRFFEDITGGAFFLKGDVSGRLETIFNDSDLEANLKLDFQEGDESESHFKAEILNNILDIDSQIMTKQLRLGAKGRLPLTRLNQPFSVALDSSQPFTLSLVADGKVDDLQRIFGFNYDYIKGDVTADIQLSGALNQQSTQGKISIRNGGYQRQNVGLELEGINFDLLPMNQGFTLKEAAPFRDSFLGKGLVSSLTVGFGEDLIPQINTNIEFEDTNIINIPNTSKGGMQARASGWLRAEGSVVDLRVSAKGEVTYLKKYIADVDSDTPIVRVNEKHLFQKHVGSIIQASEDSLAIYDIHLLLNRPFEISGQGLLSTWTGGLSILGPSKAPQYKGTFNLKSGNLRVWGKSFDVDKGTVVFDGDLDPQLYIESNLEEQDVKVKITLEGDTSRLVKRITSDSNLTEQEIFQRLFFYRGSRAVDRGFATERWKEVLPLLNYVVSSLQIDTILDFWIYQYSDPLTHQEKDILSVQKTLMDPVYLRADWVLTSGESKGFNFMGALGLKPASSIKTEVTYTPNESQVGLSAEWGYDF